MGATGVRDIAAAAGVPHGSFTNHFRSREAFNIVVLDRYAERLNGLMRQTLGNEALAPAVRLRTYFENVAKAIEDTAWTRGCMIPDLAGEIAIHNDALRERLCAVLSEQSAQFEAVVRLLRSGNSSEKEDLGAFFLAAWHGSLLRMKVERSAEPIERFRRVLSLFIDHVSASDTLLDL
jgi:TetR/AcrR family transcriptional repressor of nem operon